jgi:TonB-dependent starch-binding outer membrane protein SusC
MRRQVGKRPRGWWGVPWTALLIWLLCASTAFAQQPAATREISGTVVDVEGKPVANATVALAGGAKVTTGPDGSFKLAKAPVANATVDITAEGFTARQIAVLGARTALQLQVTLVRPAPPPAPAAPTTRTIGGVVLDGSRAPVAGATVRIRGTELAATTGADGTFAVPGVAIAEVTLDIEVPGQPPTSLPVPADKAAVLVTVGQAGPVEPPPPAARTIRGKIVDPVSGEGIPAAQVTVKGTGAVLFTEADGTFVIENAPAGVVLLDLEGPEREPRQFEVPAGVDETSIPLAQLKGEQIVIEGRAPVIVKTNLANGASVVNDADLNRVSAANIDSALQGKISGANLQFNSGAPGGGAQLRLRGISTINGQVSPLYVIDGVIVSNIAIPSGANAITAAAAGGSGSNQDNPVNRIADLNPNDIETVEVLKGASAAALYGSKAANGVVIISTKRGRQGETHVDVTQRVGLAAVANRLGSRRFRSAEDVAATYGASATSLINAYEESGGQQFDHEAEITRVPFARETVASASGGIEKGNYYGSILVRDEPGVVKGTFYEKQTGRVSIGYKFGDRVRVGLTGNLMHSISDRGLTNNDNTGTSLYVVLSGTPSFVDLRKRGDMFPVNPAVGGGANPVQTVALFQNREDVWRIIGGTTAQVDAYKSEDGAHQVKVLGNFGADSFDQKNNLLASAELSFQASQDLPGISVDASTTNLNWNSGAGVLYSYTPKSGKLRNALSGGLTYESVDLSTVYVTALGLNADQPNVDSGEASDIQHTRLRTKESGLYLQDEIALMDDRLSLLGGLLGERSSLNGNTDKYFVYPKIAAVYSLLPPSKEARPFPLDQFEALRVRAAYGEAGNRPNYGDKFTPLTATLRQDGKSGIILGGVVGDEDVVPERQREIEIGADAALKDQRVVAELTLYQRNISDLILRRTLAPSTGFTTELFNGGSMRNRGIDLALQATPVATKQAEWTTRATLTLNRSQITSLPDDVPDFNVTAAGFGAGLGAYRIARGESATQIVGGDVDGDGMENDVVGNGEPDFRVGWLNVVKTGDLTISALVDWQQGSDIVNLTRLLYDGGRVSPDVRAARERFNAFRAGDIRPYIEDATFVKLREVSVGYQVPKRIASQLGPLRTLSVSLSGRNLLTLSSYSGLDPEVSNFGNQAIGRNYDVAPYPPSRSFWLSVSAGL